MEEDDDRPTQAIDAPPAPDIEDTARDTRLGPGYEVAGYVIDGEIGRGGMGMVYSATHTVIGKRAAIKVLRPEVSKQPIVVERFIQEARAVNQIGHPNIIDIFAFGALEDGRAYHIMDLLVGESLRRRLKRGPLHPSEAASVIEETASALTAAHDKGFVHRDLKPDNIYLMARDDRWPEVKLLDFGLAKLMPESGGVAPFTTKAGVMLGTPEYMSPEQARALAVDYRTDVYALGVVMYEILAGRRPFASRPDPLATLLAHAEEQPPALQSVMPVDGPSLPVEMLQLVDAMLSKEPADRPSLAAVRTVIKRLRSTQLPTRTIAGLEMSRPGIKLPPPEPAAPSASLGSITASRLGAEAVLPDDPTRLSVDPVDTAERPGTQPPLRVPTVPPGSASIPPQPPPQPIPATQRHGSLPPMVMPVGSNPSVPPMSVAQISQLGAPRGSLHPPSPSTHGSGSGRESGPSIALPPTPSHSGLAAANAGHAGTRLGVGEVSARAMSAPVTSSQQQPAVTAAAAPKPNTIWLVLGALLFIAAGVAFALVVAG